LTGVLNFDVLCQHAVVKTSISKAEYAFYTLLVLMQLAFSLQKLLRKIVSS